MCLNYKISSRCTAEIHNHEINQRMHIVLVVYGKCYCVDVKQHYRAQNSENLQYRFEKLEIPALFRFVSCCTIIIHSPLAVAFCGCCSV